MGLENLGDLVNLGDLGDLDNSQLLTFNFQISYVDFNYKR